MDLAGEFDVEPPEVDQFARRVDLGLVRGLGLAQHRRRAQLLPPRSGEQVGGAEEDRGALVEWGRFPAGLGGDRRFDGGGRVGALGVGEGAQPRAVAVWLNHVGAGPATHAVGAADDVGQIYRVGGEHFQGIGEPGALPRAGCVFENRLVGRRGHVGDGVHALRIPAVARF